MTEDAGTIELPFAGEGVLQETRLDTDIFPEGVGEVAKERVPILSEDIKKALEELTRGYRDAKIKRGDEVVTIRVIRTNKEIEAAADLMRASTYHKIMRDNPDVPTDEEMLKALKRRGLWDEAKEERGEEINDQLLRLRNAVMRFGEDAAKKGTNPRDLSAKIELLEKKRTQLLEEQAQLEKQRSKHFSGTVDALAGVARRNYVMRSCILDAVTLKPLWPDDDVWIGAMQADNAFWVDCCRELVMFWSGLPGYEEGTSETFSDGPLETASPNSPGESAEKMPQTSTEAVA